MTGKIRSQLDRGQLRFRTADVPARALEKIGSGQADRTEILDAARMEAQRLRRHRKWGRLGIGKRVLHVDSERAVEILLEALEQQPSILFGDSLSPPKEVALFYRELSGVALPPRIAHSWNRQLGSWASQVEPTLYRGLVAATRFDEDLYESRLRSQRFLTHPKQVIALYSFGERLDELKSLVHQLGWMENLPPSYSEAYRKLKKRVGRFRLSISDGLQIQYRLSGLEPFPVQRK